MSINRQNAVNTIVRASCRGILVAYSGFTSLVSLRSRLVKGFLAPSFTTSLPGEVLTDEHKKSPCGKGIYCSQLQLFRPVNHFMPSANALLAS